MKFAYGDRVRVITDNSAQTGNVGKITNAHQGHNVENSYVVTFETGHELGYFEHEIELASELPLLDLARKLNEARELANFIPETESAEGAYGPISQGLVKVLEELVGYTHSGVAYQALLDGASVLEAVKAGREAREAADVADLEEGDN
jgi:hypothetical protein